MQSGNLTIARVFAFARSAWLVHAVADYDPGGVGAGPAGCRGEQPRWLVPLVPCYDVVGVGAVEPHGHPCVVLRWQVGSAVGVGAESDFAKC